MRRMIYAATGARTIGPIRHAIAMPQLGRLVASAATLHVWSSVRSYATAISVRQFSIDMYAGSTCATSWHISVAAAAVRILTLLDHSAWYGCAVRGGICQPSDSRICCCGLQIHTFLHTCFQQLPSSYTTGGLRCKLTCCLMSTLL